MSFSCQSMRAPSALILSHMAVPTKNLKTRNFRESLVNEHPIKMTTRPIYSKFRSMCLPISVNVVQGHELPSRFSAASAIRSVVLKYFSAQFFAVLPICFSSKLRVLLPGSGNPFRKFIKALTAPRPSWYSFPVGVGVTYSFLSSLRIFSMHFSPASLADYIPIGRLAAPHAESFFLIIFVLLTTADHVYSIQ